VDLSLAARVALITGAGSGIGRDFARFLACGGASVACLGRRADAVQATVSELRDNGFDAIAVTGDVGVDEDVQRVVTQVTDWKGRLDILVNNAGIYPPGTVTKMAESDWRRTIDTNLTGAYLCIRHAAPVMAKSGYGRVVNVTSPSSLLGAVGQGAYAASKAALNSLTQSAAAELGRKGITVNAILMGVVATDSFVAAYPEGTVEVLAERLPIPRAGSAQDAEGLLRVLASAAGAYITGAVIPVDGGMTNAMPLV
jgi:NAD(P)-dependent dehydrogenase (short-subunit alcohol dehydrogenase family)